MGKSGDWVDKGLRKKEQKREECVDTDNSVVIAGRRVVAEGRGRYRGINGDGMRLDRGGEHKIQCTGDVLWNCAPETCMILLVSPQ